MAIGFNFLSMQTLSFLLLSSMFAPYQAFMKTNPMSTSSIVRNNLHMTNQEPLSPFGTARSYVKEASAVSVALSVLTFSRGAKAGLFQSDEQDAVDKINYYQKPVFELLSQLSPNVIPNAVGVFAKTQVLKDGKEDADVVLNYMSTYIVPCQTKMLEVAPKLKLKDPVAQTRLELLPLLMKGHILELTQAISSMKAENQAKEVKEVSETLAEYLLLASTQYKVVPYIAPGILTDKEYLGPFGCEFWGKKRIEGTNACMAIPEPEVKK
jgi:hypothetical protein